MANRNQQGPPGYRAATAAPLIEGGGGQELPLNSLPPRSEDGWEKKVNPLKYLDPGPGPSVAPETIVSVSVFMILV